jgi:hypothetical protein
MVCRQRPSSWCREHMSGRRTAASPWQPLGFAPIGIQWPSHPLADLAVPFARPRRSHPSHETHGSPSPRRRPVRGLGFSAAVLRIRSTRTRERSFRPPTHPRSARCRRCRGDLFAERVGVVFDWYDRLRPHQALGNTTPAEVFGGAPRPGAAPAPRDRRGEATEPLGIVIPFVLPAERRLPYLERAA